MVVEILVIFIGEFIILHLLTTRFRKNWLQINDLKKKTMKFLSSVSLLTVFFHAVYEKNHENMEEIMEN